MIYIFGVFCLCVGYITFNRTIDLSSKSEPWRTSDIRYNLYIDSEISRSKTKKNKVGLKLIEESDYQKQVVLVDDFDKITDRIDSLNSERKFG